MSRFTAHLGLIQVEDALGRPLINQAGRTLWDLVSELPYEVGEEGSGEVITAPAGMRTDLGSIPRAVWSWGFAPNGPGSKAYVIHDFLYATAGTCMWMGEVRRTRPKPYSRAEADAILREALAVLGVPLWKRMAIWAAVRAGGAGGWGG